MRNSDHRIWLSNSLNQGLFSNQQLDVQAHAMSDNEAAQRLNDARAIRFKIIF